MKKGTTFQGVEFVCVHISPHDDGRDDDDDDDDDDDAGGGGGGGDGDVDVGVDSDVANAQDAPDGDHHATEAAKKH